MTLNEQGAHYVGGERHWGICPLCGHAPPEGDKGRSVYDSSLEEVIKGAVHDALRAAPLLRDWNTMEQTAAYLGCSVRHLRDLRRERVLPEPTMHLGKAMYTREQLDMVRASANIRAGVTSKRELL
jgi:hypothetical protein